MSISPVLSAGQIASKIGVFDYTIFKITSTIVNNNRMLKLCATLIITMFQLYHDDMTRPSVTGNSDNNKNKQKTSIDVVAVLSHKKLMTKSALK